MAFDTDPAVTDAAERDLLFKRVWQICRDARALSGQELTAFYYFVMEAAKVLDRETVRRWPRVTDDEYVALPATRLVNFLSLDLEFPRGMVLAVLAHVQETLTADW